MTLLKIVILLLTAICVFDAVIDTLNQEYFSGIRLLGALVFYWIVVKLVK